MQTLISPEAFAHVDMTVGGSQVSCKGMCVTIGNFDGVHVGHQSLLQRTVSKSRKSGLLSGVVTFWPHPLQVLAAGRAPALLLTQESRLSLFAEQGIDIALEMPFTKHLASLTPEDFVRTVLVPLRCRELVIGYDFSLGKSRAGNFEVLQNLGAKYDFCVEQLSPVIVRDGVVSSTRIRNHIRAGEVWEAGLLLGRSYGIEGVVVHGHGRGKALGYPTANITSESVTNGLALIPRYGVYATFVRLLDGSGLSSGVSFAAVTNVGLVPTFGNDALSIESFILDGSPSLYGARIALTFVERLRDEQKFSGVQELQDRIGKDIVLAKEILKQ